MRGSTEQRFWAKVKKDTESGCWEWQASKGRGYGLFSVNRRLVPAHRWLYEQVHGELPDTVTLDHLCRNRSCVNPDHLEPVTNKVNVLRGEGNSAQNARKEHCPKGHPYEGENLYVDPSGRRQCRTCRKERDRQHKLKVWQGNPPNSKRTHCPRGHPYEGENLIQINGRRICRECKNEWQRQRRASRKT